MKKSKNPFSQSLLEKGILPENLPPVFRVKGLYDASLKLKLFSDDQTQRNHPTSPARYSATKRGGQRRVFSTPNPVFFIDACAYFEKNLPDYQKLYAQSPISHSIPQISLDAERAVSIESFSQFSRARKRALARFKYIVKIDVARFFPSIYTHSIPWALHSKKLAKKDRKVESELVHANKIDYLVRQAQDQQTIGIPIGPDTSRLISEAIACAVDRRFLEIAGSHVSAARLVDDIFIGANSAAEAEQLLSQYRSALSEFELVS